MKKQDLHIIFQNLQHGDSNILNNLYNEYNRLIYGIAFSILKNKEDSEDIVQIVFMKIFQMDKTKLPTNNEASWLYSLTKNETLNYLRKKKQELNLDEIYYISEEDKELNKIIDNDSYNRLIAKLDVKCTYGNSTMEILYLFIHFKIIIRQHFNGYYWNITFDKRKYYKQKNARN